MCLTPFFDLKCCVCRRVCSYVVETGFIFENASFVGAVNVLFELETLLVCHSVLDSIQLILFLYLFAYHDVEDRSFVFRVRTEDCKFGESYKNVHTRWCCMRGVGVRGMLTALLCLLNIAIIIIL